jgi:hypothetical protein
LIILAEAIKFFTSWLSRKSVTILGRRTIPEPSTPHLDKGVADVAQTATLVYIEPRIPQIAINQTSFYATMAIFAGLAHILGLLRAFDLYMTCLTRL